MAVDKGAINDGHVLVLPIEHYPSSLQVLPSRAQRPGFGLLRCALPSVVLLIKHCPSLSCTKFSNGFTVGSTRSSRCRRTLRSALLLPGTRLHALLAHRHIPA